MPEAVAAGADDSVRWRRGVALWCLIITSESVNGLLRELYLKPWLGTNVAKPISFAIATVLILLIAWLFAPWLGATTTRAQLKVGALWLVLTFAFEAMLAYALGLSPDAFLAEYDLTRGGLMLPGMLILLFAPRIGASVHSTY